eukprot:3255309-Prymnesium_polylepis.1
METRPSVDTLAYRRGRSACSNAYSIPTESLSCTRRRCDDSARAAVRLTVAVGPRDITEDAEQRGVPGSGRFWVST